MTAGYEICAKCVMDTTDPQIFFDSQGFCNHCTGAIEILRITNSMNVDIDNLIKRIKYDSSKREFDAIVGISGGVDSSYLVHKLFGYGLRLLLVHVDAGWNAITAVNNINRLVNTHNLELETIIIDWNTMRDLQVTYLKSGVINQDVPQDHAFFASLYKCAIENNIKYIFSGTNVATESIGPSAWGQFAMDSRNLKAIYRSINGTKISNFSLFSIPKWYFHVYVLKNFEIINFLNYLPYSKSLAIKVLEEEYGWEDYGGKHRESSFTTYYQDIYLPQRLGIDKRRMHLSSLIVLGDLEREEALIILQNPASSAIEADNLRRYIASKLSIDVTQLLAYERLPLKSYLDYENDQWFLNLVARVAGWRRIFLRFIKKPWKINV
jgi:N-acetyl sugar amidotransferase